jgi:hypothetical protein
MDDYGCHCGIYIFVSVRHKERNERNMKREKKESQEIPSGYYS